MIFDEIQKDLESKGFNIVKTDFERPWGGFFVIDENQTALFVETFFAGLPSENLQGFAKLSPKILVVAPDKRLSWQYHFRRAEIWRVYKGKVAVALSHDDTEREQVTLSESAQIILDCGQRHRLIGLDDYGVVAEIWQHTDASLPSDEDDIVRVQDDFGR